MSARLIDQLVDRRLLRVEEREGMRRVELTHDLLTGVIRDSRDRRRDRVELAPDSSGRVRRIGSIFVHAVQRTMIPIIVGMTMGSLFARSHSVAKR